jgi:hypothetical protein
MKIAFPTARRTLARRALIAPLALTLSLGAAACAETGGSNNGGGGESVPAGASQEEFVAALADMNETTITIQVPSAKGDTTAEPYETYASMAEEWSGGKLKFELAYGNSIAPVTETIAPVFCARARPAANASSERAVESTPFCWRSQIAQSCSEVSCQNGISLSSW